MITKEMPKYKSRSSNNEVRALEIKDINTNTDKVFTAGNGGAIIMFEKDDYAPIVVGINYMFKYRPEVGGYYIIAENGYESFLSSYIFNLSYYRF